VNDIIRTHKASIKDSGLNSYQLRHLNNLSKCHTEELGGQAQICKSCGVVQYTYHSCRNRHCPSCQGGKREEWIQRQEKYLLDVPYYHLVFTLPSELHGLCLAHPRVMYNTLFKVSWETLQTLCKDPKHLGARPGMTAVLHTWGQDLSLHPHLHCIVPGGGVTKSRKWKYTKSKGKFLIHYNILRPVYRAIFIRELKHLKAEGIIDISTGLLQKLNRKKWVVYAKRPFSKPQDVIEYLGRYTHKVAISNYRLLKVSDEQITFQLKDYRHDGKLTKMKLPAMEFLRRFSLHILPHRYVRIRHYGILSYHGRSKIIPELQKTQNFVPQISQTVCRPSWEGFPDICSACGSEDLKTIILPKAKNRSP